MSLNFILGRADKDFHKYMYDRIAGQMAEDTKNILILVPDQFTLQAERIAFEYLKVEGLIGVEVLSFSRLAHRILGEVGGTSKIHINEHGKHMILYKIISESKENLEVFKNVATKHGFIDILNEFITELKQFNIGHKELKAIANEIEDNKILKKKLLDTGFIYEKLHGYLENKFIDSEDFINLLIEKAEMSSLLKDAVIWVDGFDYFNPQTILLLEKLMLLAKEVNINFLLDDTLHARDKDVFEVSKYSMSRCAEIADRNNLSYDTIHLSNDFRIESIKEVSFLEKELYAYPYESYESNIENVEIYACSSYNSEIESIALKIIELVREKGYRYRDIAVICNDMDNYGGIIKRAFEEYMIPAFIDVKRNIMHNPFVEYILSLLDVVSKNYRYEDIFRFLKTGFSDFDEDICNGLENYALRYGIKGELWKKDFIYGADEIGQDNLNQLNESRKELIKLFEGFEKIINKDGNVAEKTERLYDFIKNETNINEKMDAWLEYLGSNNELGYVKETAQIWNVIFMVFDQIVELVGELEISLEEYVNMIRAGLESVQVAIIPTTADQVLVGTLQRSRIGSVKALFLLGVNDGIIPGNKKDDSILINEERQFLLDRDIELGKNEIFKLKEEKLSIYRIISKAQEYLWLSYTVTDAEGKEMRPSLLIDRLRKLFINIKINKDILDNTVNSRIISNPDGTIKYLVEHLKSAVEGKEMPYLWKHVFNWYLQQGKYDRHMQLIYSGLFFDNKAENLSKGHIQALYRMPYSFSPTRLEKFLLCPFSHFVQYGIKAEERKIRQVAMAEMGEILHQSLLGFTEEVHRRGVLWRHINRQQCSEIMEKVINDISANYGEGILKRNGRNIYRLSRLKRTAEKTAWILTEHVKKGKFDEFYFEVTFGRKGKFPPIQVILPNNETIYIEGRIDRVDVLRTEKDTFIKVIDYKSGSKTLNLMEVINGLQLQLMIYLHAAINGFSGNTNKVKPAGVFYFKVDDPIIEYQNVQSQEDIIEIVENQIRKYYKMDGLVLKDVNLIRSIDDEIDGYSQIIPVNIKKIGELGDRSKTLSESDFDKLITHMVDLTNEICFSIMDGAIDIRPKKIDNNRTACSFCKYKTICQFDTSLANQKYDTPYKVKLEEILTDN